MTEQLNHWWFVGIGYGLMWAATLWYLSRLRRLEQACRRRDRA